MIVTDLVEKLHSDYDSTYLRVNHSLKYIFEYNGYLTDVFYSKRDNMQNQLLIAIEINDITYLSTLYFAKDKDNAYHMKYYLPNELYNNVKDYLLINDKYSTTPYFNTMYETIMSIMPIGVNARHNINGRNVHKYTHHSDNPFFETVIRKSMSDDMKKKIRDKYPSNIAKEIFQFYGHTKTLRFTSDFTKAHDISTFIRKSN